MIKSSCVWHIGQKERSYYHSWAQRLRSMRLRLSRRSRISRLEGLLSWEGQEESVDQFASVFLLLHRLVASLIFWSIRLFRKLKRNFSRITAYTRWRYSWVRKVPCWLEAVTIVDSCALVTRSLPSRSLAVRSSAYSTSTRWRNA